MFLQRTISRLIVFVFAFLTIGHAMAAGETEQATSPYRSEYNPWFKLGIFKRGFKNETLKLHLDSLESKPRRSWTRQDSLKFAVVSMKTGNSELATYYFDHLTINFEQEEEIWWNRLVLHFIQREYNSCVSMIRKQEPGLVEFTKFWFFKKICDAKLRSLRDEKWYKTESVLSWEVDSSLMLLDKDSPEFYEKVILPLENLNFVLEKIIRFIHDEDEVLARTCYEMGLILDAYISPTQAYIAMCLGRNYDKWDKEILQGMKLAKAHIVEKNYRIPIFRKNFPRIEYWRFDYEMLKEKIIYERSDTAVKTAPVLRKKVDEPKFAINSQFVILAGLIVIFVSILLFLKTGKKNV
ncbi:MAG: hypothetical protein IPH24_14925 [Crocinitomicaceae bacterium]|nr:hypothetical protein [Crocinitomicaceae bacterium]